MLGRRTFDDLYRLGRDRRLAFTGEDGASVEVQGEPALPLRAGVGAAGQAVRRARADGRAHQRARHRRTRTWSSPATPSPPRFTLAVT